jgi:3-oxoacyl-[acyl-carrier-protein] synthase II
MSGLRPTHYLGQLSNLLAGNISIVHKATGSSRTFKGEEMAGVAAVEEAVCRLAAGQSQLMLVGAALNAERQDLLLSLELGGALLPGSYRPVSARADVGGGMIPGSVGVFLVIETPEHARARGAGAYASIGALVCDRSRRKPGDAEMAGRTLMRSLRPLIDGGSPLGILSGASGVEPIAREEGAFLHDLARSARILTPWAYGSSLGHGIEAHFLSGVALAALALAKGTVIERTDGNSRERDGSPPCRQILVTGFGHWRGEALGLVDAIPEGSSWAK